MFTTPHTSLAPPPPPGTGAGRNVNALGPPGMEGGAYLSIENLSEYLGTDTAPRLKADVPGAPRGPVPKPKGLNFLPAFTEVEVSVCEATAAHREERVVRTGGGTAARPRGILVPRDNRHSGRQATSRCGLGVPLDGAAMGGELWSKRGILGIAIDPAKASKF